MVVMGAVLVDQQTSDKFRLLDITVLGRKKDCPLCLPDPRVSRQHAMVRRQGVGEFWFYDLGSINGSYINDERVITTQRLRHDDVIRISDFQFTFEAEDPETDNDDEARFERETVTDIRTLPVLLLVSDIQNFSILESTLRPEELAQVVGGWYRESTQALQTHGATIDKFVKHAVLAYWSDTDISMREQTLEAALALQQAGRFISDDYGPILEPHGLQFRCNIALNLGKVAHGVLSEGYSSMVGEAVNVSFRLEKLAGQLHEEIIASAEFLNGWGEAIALFTPRGRHMVQGRSSPVELFGLKTDG